ncbi:DUF4392 domain-containing protein [Alkaliphilus serpentinus]|uniref:DUF4392 domain-containing protein n=1 Tax=Alkaliphilus serpentinus TaxID=1482731 RepID=A0A833HQ44_9FIRM|nr:DUF4392 domain-containing protein [Alkaliphilus serpentinus]KAB3531498.1 DUF4392 domain-containing protein [Alkaliphilus serpentinus]
MYKGFFDEIEEIISVDYGKRGLKSLIQKGDLEDSIEELYVNSQRVMIITGFCIKDAMIGETDGPLGAVSIANGLMQLGKDVVFVTDEFSSPLIEGCCRALNIDASIYITPFGDTKGFCKKLIEVFHPTHIIAIERPGRGRDGKCYSMRGEDLSPFVPNTDYFFILAKEKNIKTIAIGDGGNEMGMGKVIHLINEEIKEGQRIWAETASDYLIIAGVSNWGGHGITAGLSILASEMLLHQSHEEVKMVSAMVNAGGVDGCSKKREMTVDGLSLEINLDIFNKIRGVVIRALKEADREIG